MKKKVLIIFLFFFMLFSMSSCTELDEDVILIDSIASEVLEDGRTKIIVKYINEDVEDSIFYIPRGKDGIGISDFVYKINSDKNTTDVTFSFTDSLNDYTVAIPNGRGIANVLYTEAEDGNTLVTFIFTDGTKSDPVRINKGETGTSLINFEPVINPDGTLDLKFVYSDGSEYNAKVPAPQKGDTGRGITSIVTETTDTSWQLIVFYSDDTFDVVEFERPSTILSGVNPTDEIGKDGDFFYDTAKKIFYNKVDGSWTRIIQFADEAVKYTITFDLNCVDSSAKLNGKQQIAVSKNTTVDSNVIPIPTREGYKFDGWYLVEDAGVNNGKFTDMTIVIKDIVLYAKWIVE